jgi:alpha-D-xyloside xylohydrolase
LPSYQRKSKLVFQYGYYLSTGCLEIQPWLTALDHDHFCACSDGCFCQRLDNVDDEYMFGPAFLVCPVTKPMYFAANSIPLQGVEKTRSVYLPSGSDWYDFWTGDRYAGGQTISANAPLETTPLFVRSGSIVPVGPNIQFTGDQPNAPVELWLYPGQDGAFTLYEDEGDNYNYEKGNFAMTHIAWNDSTRQLTLEHRQGCYPGMPASQVFRVVIATEKPFDPRAVEAAHAREIFYDGKRIVVDLG